MSIPPDFIRRFPHADDWSDYTNTHEFLPPPLGGPGRIDKHKQPLHYAIFQGDIPGLQKLLSSGELPPEATLSPPDVHNDDQADLPDSIPPCTTPYGTALQYAASLGHLAAVDALLDAGANPRWAVEDHELTPRPCCRPVTSEPIALAIIYGHRDVVARLWERSSMAHYVPAKPSLVERANYSFSLFNFIPFCLKLAVHSGQIDIIQDLLSWVSDWDSFSYEPGQGHALESALSIAVSKWDPHVAAVLLQQDGKSYTFDRQFLSGCLSNACLGKRDTLLVTAENVLYSGMDYINQSILIGLLIKAGADPSFRHFNQPLLNNAAVCAEWTGALKALLENGANPNEKDSRHGLTALHTAVGTVKYCPADPAIETVRYTWNETAVRLLLDHGASATQGSFHGTTPLHAAARTSDTRLFNLVIKSTTPLEQPIHPSTWGVTNHHGETLLHHACLGGRVDIVELLLDQGLDVNQRSKLGWTPFMCALAPERRDWMERDGDWTLKDAKSVLDIVQLLVARGADTNAISDSGWTALHVLSLWGCGGDEQSILFPLALQLLQDTPSLVDAPEPLPMPKDWNVTDMHPGRDDIFHWTEPRRNISILQWAIEKESRDVLNALREVGVDTTAKNADGKTAFEAASEYTDPWGCGRSPLLE